MFLAFKLVTLLLNTTAKYAPEVSLFPEASHRVTVNEVIFGAEYGRTLTSQVVDAVLPLESVTVVLIVNVPEADKAVVVTLAEVYVLPSIVVLYALIVDP